MHFMFHFCFLSLGTRTVITCLVGWGQGSDCSLVHNYLSQSWEEKLWMDTMKSNEPEWDLESLGTGIHLKTEAQENYHKAEVTIPQAIGPVLLMTC